MKYSLIWDIARRCKFNAFARKWRKKNAHNEILPMCIFPEDRVSAGKGSYGELNVISFGESAELKIGNFVSIAQNVTFILDAEHHLDHISTYPFRVKMLKECKYEAFSKGNIVVDDDVWRGYGAIIMSGVHIGQGAVIAAGAVVTKDVEPYAIVGGMPAKRIRYRFDEDIRDKLVQIDFNKIDEYYVKNHIQDLYRKVQIEDCDTYNEIMSKNKQTGNA